MCLTRTLCKSAPNYFVKALEKIVCIFKTDIFLAYCGHPRETTRGPCLTEEEVTN